MAFADLRPSWEWVLYPLMFLAGQYYQRPSAPVHLHCPGSSEPDTEPAVGSWGWGSLLLALVVGVLLGLWGPLKLAPRLIRVRSARALFRD